MKIRPTPAPAPTAPYDAEYTAPARAILFGIAGHYLDTEALALLERACAFAFRAHDGQTRKSGEPYITHPIAVSAELAKWGMDIETLCAGLMHDVLEDTDVDYMQMANRFGTVITDLVDGVSKLDKFEYSDKAQHQAESFRKLAMAMTKDVRVIMVKLADRLHNMRTLGGVGKVEKRRSTSRETLEIHAPIAHRLGLNSVYREMQDLAFANLYPERFRALEKAMVTFRQQYGHVIDTVVEKFAAGLAEHGIAAELDGREKHVYSIYEKMKRRKLHFKEVFDIYSIRVLVDSNLDCYTALGVMHMLYRPDLRRFKDHIAIPKSNSYQSLHTTLKGPSGLPIEVQIRTRQMHSIAESGIAAVLDSEDTWAHTKRWLSDILELQERSEGDAAEFLQNVKSDLAGNEVYVYTPQGEIITLPRGATALDFAYAIHTDVGNSCAVVKINKKVCPLRTCLHNGDQVEIVRSQQVQPKAQWLDWVVTGRAAAAIKQYLKRRSRSNTVRLGQTLLQQAWAAMVGQQPVPELDEESLLRIGSGELPVQEAVRRLARQHGVQANDWADAVPYRVDAAAAGVLLGTCCHPVAGDAVGAVRSAGHGFTVHREHCPQLLQAAPEQRVEAVWQGRSEHGYDVALTVSCLDAHGLLAALTSAVSANGGNINALDTVAEADDTGMMVFRFHVRVADLAGLHKLTDALAKVKQVRSVKRG
ncbi:RelA/SpoT family protein [Conchiformibius kuhniae]|uniref:RelA/SpoT family protein n=1 Tax=Conchiformibius kuhniae TaxID=211502 RepID=A0ABD8B7Z8_9NEIS|nr:bifunctional (p)ppGpp synthetase/guanosine-3',5'-bis(diphosphate) 3'-pyrophosphohydrolase [Conchiformibius kuhniae]